jgi:hypothetical protein
MRCRELAVDIQEVDRRRRDGRSPHLTDAEALYYVLRVLHVMAESFERVADAYCARHPNVPRYPEGT